MVRKVKRYGLSMAVTHWNAPYGSVVSVDDLAESLRHGEIRTSSENVAAILSYLFIELEVRPVMRCAMAAGATMPKANQLHLSMLEQGSPACPEWESSLRDLL